MSCFVSGKRFECGRVSGWAVAEGVERRAAVEERVRVRGVQSHLQGYHAHKKTHLQRYLAHKKTRTYRGTSLIRRRPPLGPYSNCELCIGWRARSHSRGPAATSNQIPITSDQLSIKSNQLSITSNQIPITTNQLLITSNQIPITSHQHTITVNQIPITSNQVPITSHM